MKREGGMRDVIIFVKRGSVTRPPTLQSGNKPDLYPSPSIENRTPPPPSSSALQIGGNLFYIK
jgi:hypothetical protein